MSLKTVINIGQFSHHPSIHTSRLMSAYEIAKLQPYGQNRSPLT